MDATSSCSNQKQYHRNALKRKIEFYRHNISLEDKEEVICVLDSLFLTTGDVAAQFEQKFANYIGSKFVVGVMSCTHALELTLRYYGIGPGDEVITTPLSFVATANAIEYVGAKPVFVDVEEMTGNINVELIEKAITKKTKAIIPVHLYGQMCDMVKIRRLADMYDLKVIEDAAHCVEGERDGYKPGQLGDVACFSFYATKALTSGEGGAITCNDERMYEWFVAACQHGISKRAADRYTKKYEHYDMGFLGIKANMSNIQAALLIHQIGRIDEHWHTKMMIADCYTQAFVSSDCIKIPRTLPVVKHAWHLYTILVNPKKRDEYLHRIQDCGIGVAVNYKPIHLMRYYQKKYGYKDGDFFCAERIGSATISLPFYSQLKRNDIDFIIDVVKREIL